MHCEELLLDFLNICAFSHPQIPDFQIVVSQPNTLLKTKVLHDIGSIEPLTSEEAFRFTKGSLC